MLGSRQGRSRFPISRSVFAVALNTLAIIGHKAGSYKSSENSLFGELMEELSHGDIIVGDRRFAGAKLYIEEIRLLYRKRWKMERLIEEIKIWLGADVLRSKTVEGIYKELYARLIAFSLIHWLILKASERHQKDVQRISFSAAVRLMATYSMKMSVAPFWMLPLLYEELLEKVASSIVPYRPERIEPRLKKRDQKHYGLLKISRAEWRAVNCLAA